MQYPIPATDNVKPAGFNGKQSVEKLLQLALDLHSRGLYAVPKKTGDKIAHWKFWMKKDGHVPLVPNEENLRAWLPKPEIDGFILAVGRSLDGRLAVLDIDPHNDHTEGAATFNAIQALSPSGYVFATPGNGVHIYYQLPEGAPALKPANSRVWGNADIRCKNSLLGLEGNYQQYTDKAEKKGVAYGHVGYYRRVDDGDYSSIPFMSHELYQVLWEAQNKKKYNEIEQGGTLEEYVASPLAVKRLHDHFMRSASEREMLVKECIDAIFSGYGEKWTRDEFFKVSFGAHHGSNGSTDIRDYIISHPKSPYASNKRAIDTFIKEWDDHIHIDGGISFSTLVWFAKQYGWLSQTGHEIPDGIAKHINVRYVQEWIEEEIDIPVRCLLMSQTGSGKTYSLKYLYERLGKPKTVVFVPSTKLAMEMAGTLYNEYGLPTTLYINPANGVIKDTKELAAADILITTLQTFATKVFKKGVPMSNYGLVYVEESDQLLQQFARGGDVTKNIKSHVSQHEAQAGYATIRKVFEEAGVVWCVDATMSRVTYEVAESLRGDTPMTVIKNDWTQPKAAVQMLDTRGDAYQTVVDSLRADKRVVVSCDTQQAAEELRNTLLSMQLLDGKKHLCITKNSERDKDVIEFMGNVNVFAPQYDLVIYNSVMASGVSITSVTPDVVVQIATYLTPRSNIQMLNRYRKQDKVYCYYRDTENLYVKNAIELQTEAERKAWVEAGVVNIAVAQRSDDAILRNRIVAISVADEYEQERSAKDFYIALLKGDGREVSNPFQSTISATLKAAVAEVRGLAKAEKEYVREHWHEVEPIEVDAVVDESMNRRERIQGRTHRHIRDLFNGEIPDADPAEIYDIAKAFSGKLGVISSFLQQEKALEKSKKDLLNYEVSVMMLANKITLMKVISCIHMLYRTLDEEIDDAILDARASLFMAYLSGMSADYDSVIARDRQKYQEVYDRTDNDRDRALDFCKILLSYVGLKQRSVQVSRKGKRISVNRIENLVEFHKFLEWRKLGDIEVLTIDALSDSIEGSANAIEKFKKMDDTTQSLVIALVNQHNNIDFQSAVEIALDRGDKF